MARVTYPNEQIAKTVMDNFVPVQINAVDHPEYKDRFLERWTPAIFFMDAEGRTHRRQIGYRPPEDFAAELLIGLAQEAFNMQRYEEAAERYHHIVEQYPNADVAPEALYMEGVARYRATDDGSYLDNYWDMVIERYPGSRWAKAGDID